MIWAIRYWSSGVHKLSCTWCMILKTKKRNSVKDDKFLLYTRARARALWQRYVTLCNYVIIMHERFGIGIWTAVHMEERGLRDRVRHLPKDLSKQDCGSSAKSHGEMTLRFPVKSGKPCVMFARLGQFLLFCWPSVDASVWYGEYALDSRVNHGITATKCRMRKDRRYCSC